MKLSLSLLVAVGLVSTFGLNSEQHLRAQYEQFKVTYNKNYANDDDENRFVIFKQNMHRASQQQAVEQGTAEYGVTQFSDLTDEEFTARFTGMVMPENTEEVSSETVGEPVNDEFDWRMHGAVGPVQEQGDCGSCWAFSVIGNVEGQWFRKTGQLLKLSEQELIDCDHVDHGCKGGFPPQAYAEIQRIGGLELLADYPYEARDGLCHLESRKLKAFVNGSTVFPSDENKLAQSLKAYGPLSAGINAGHLKLYRRGVMHPPSWSCSIQGMNHAVLLVAYGTEKRVPYWTVRNSWGPSFGEKGYFRIFRGDGTCGINQVVSTALVR